MASPMSFPAPTTPTSVPAFIPNDSAPLLADDEPDELEVTSDFDSESRATSTQSVTESVLEHVYENGRRYHMKVISKSQGHWRRHGCWTVSLGKYNLPSDEIEQSRLDLYHHLHLELLGGRLHMAEFAHDPHIVLDCGTGTGPRPMSNSISTISSCRGIFHEKFDYIHSGDLVTSLKNWPRYFEQIYEYSNPGGVVEIVEHCLGWRCDDDSMGPDSPIVEYNKYLISGFKAMGTSPENNASDYKRMLEEAGFTDVQTYEYKVAAGTWARGIRKKRLGQIVMDCLESGLESYAKEDVECDEDEGPYLLFCVALCCEETGVGCYLSGRKRNRIMMLEAPESKLNVFEVQAQDYGNGVCKSGLLFDYSTRR
ncbi:hypothetical protein EX30DRAFT_196981 [Ascodesmis nigricans]|uniref:S-adenosyl-L-methionine-dependent methyltransferase n=1 Tax=Ascodesmis nigricans TaxID=341454 RepID=A0A4S2MQ93_9PEZI|nr:hypothetical protein EX30DRAFT_196981 [Ascodesmis nigricans]